MEALLSEGSVYQAALASSSYALVSTQLAFETGEIGRLAGGAVMASLGGTVSCTTQLLMLKWQHTVATGLLLIERGRSSTCFCNIPTVAVLNPLLCLQVIYTTACSATSSADDGDFMPLSVHYAERYSSAGKTRSASCVHFEHEIAGLGTAGVR